MSDNILFALNFYVAQPLVLLLLLMLLPRWIGLPISALALAGALVFWFVNAMDAPSGPYIDMGSGLRAMWAAALAGGAAGALAFQVVRARALRPWLRASATVVSGAVLAFGLVTLMRYMPAFTR